jgi:L-iditol 2-dehydrogenase
VLVEVRAVGLCGSDRHWFEEGGIGEVSLTRPLVLGHEIAGVIAEGSRAGDRVAIDPSQPCERCPTCVRGRPDLCPTTRFAGYGATDGGLRTWMTWPGDLCHAVPDAMTDDEAAVMEALGVARHAVDLAEAGPSDRVAVIGAGPIGQLVIRVLAADGIASIVASDPRPHRRAAALASGASSAWAPDDLPAEPALGEVSIVIECAGEDAAVDAAVHLVRPGGRVVLVGIPSEERTTFRAAVARRKGLSVTWSRRMTAADLPAAIRLVETGAVEVAPIISDRFPLSSAAAAFQRLASGDANKIVVRPDRTD